MFLSESTYRAIANAADALGIDESIQHILFNCETVDYMVVKQHLEDYFQHIKHYGKSFFKDKLALFANIMYNKYSLYTKSHIDRYIDDLSTEGIKEFHQLVEIISDEMKDWTFHSDKDMFNYIKEVSSSKFNVLRSEIDLDEIIHPLFISEKLNRIYHLTRELFLPELMSIV